MKMNPITDVYNLQVGMPLCIPVLSNSDNMMNTMSAKDDKTNVKQDFEDVCSKCKRP
jgi:hypothetical protein